MTKTYIIEVVKVSEIENTGDMIKVAQYNSELPEFSYDLTPVSVPEVDVKMREVHTVSLVTGPAIRVALKDEYTEKLLNGFLREHRHLISKYMEADIDMRHYRSQFIKTEQLLNDYRSLMKTIRSTISSASFLTRLKFLIRLEKFKHLLSIPQDDLKCYELNEEKTNQ